MSAWRIAAVCLVSVLLPCAAFGEIYGWVDENGVKHYSNDPPPEGGTVFSQDIEIKTDEPQLQKQAESDRQDLKEPEQQAPESEAPSEGSTDTVAEPVGSEPGVAEDAEREAFHRERIKRRTRQNTSPAPSLQSQPRSQ